MSYGFKKAMREALLKQFEGKLIMKYRKKPVVIEAIKFTFFDEVLSKTYGRNRNPQCHKNTREHHLP